METTRSPIDLSSSSTSFVSLVEVPDDINLAKHPVTVEHQNTEMSVDQAVTDSTQTDGNATVKKESAPRAIFVDWIRAIAIYLVVFAHTLVSVRRIYGDNEISAIAQSKIDGTLRCFLQYGMPIFFYFSGRGAAFNKDGPVAFLWKKTVRLLLPLFVGMNIVVIPTAYIGRSYRPCASRDIDNFFVFWMDFWTKQFYCSGFEWLWFLPVLWGISVFTGPVTLWLIRRNKMHLDPSSTTSQLQKEHKEIKTLSRRVSSAFLHAQSVHLASVSNSSFHSALLSAAQAAAAGRTPPPSTVTLNVNSNQPVMPVESPMSITLPLSKQDLGAGVMSDDGGVMSPMSPTTEPPIVVASKAPFNFQHFPLDNFFLVCQCILLVCLLLIFAFAGIGMAFWLLFVAQFIALMVLGCSIPFLRARHLTHLFLWVPILTVLGLAAVQSQAVTSDNVSAFIMISYHTLFYVYGFVSQLFSADIKILRDSHGFKQLRPVSMVLMVLLFALSSPTTDEEVGYYYTFPLYTNSLYRVSFCIGTFLWIYMLKTWGEVFFNEKISDWQYKHVTQTSVVVYVFHWLFLDVFNVIFGTYIKTVAPLLICITFGYIFSVFGCWGVYAIARHFPPLAFAFGVEPVRHSRARSKRPHAPVAGSSVEMLTSPSSSPAPKTLSLLSHEADSAAKASAFYSSSSSSSASAGVPAEAVAAV